MTIKPRVKKLTIQDRLAIIELAMTKKHTYTYIGALFGVSRGRVSQLVNNTYDENKFFGDYNAEQE
jgi:DNA-directed RNA polymerase specialized sigma subunit